MNPLYVIKGKNITGELILPLGILIGRIPPMVDPVQQIFQIRR